MAEKKKASVAAPAISDRKKALETAIAKIEKDYGKGTIMRLGDDISINVEALSTGSLSLDLALGIGGLPKGRIIEIYGPEASGKTTLALHAVASAQKAGGDAAYIDVEHALEPGYAQALGVDINSLLISQPDTGEQALDIAESLVRSGAVDVVVIDSVAALIPRVELEGEVGDTVVGALARLMSQAMRRLAGAISKNNCTVIFINQLRQKIGVMYGNPETTPGGLALKYYSSVRIDVRRIETLKSGGEVYRVEDTICRLIRAYGGENPHVFAIPSHIVATAEMGGREMTSSRRLMAPCINLEMLDRVNDLARHVCRETPDAKTMRARLEAVEATPTYTLWQKMFIYALVAFSFTLFFGGNLADAIASALIGVVMLFCARLSHTLRGNTLFNDILSAAVAAALAVTSVRLGLAADADKIIIGNVMPLALPWARRAF